MNRNINTRYDTHRMFCDRSEAGDRSGDVRICKHGKIQMNYGILGLSGGIWQDLSPFWHPIKFNRAKKVLLADETVDEDIEGYTPTPGLNVFADSPGMGLNSGMFLDTPPHPLENSIIHFFSSNNGQMYGPLCEVGDWGEWVQFDHTAVGKICDDCQARLGREIR